MIFFSLAYQETWFAQLCDQFMLRRKYAKTIAGLSVRSCRRLLLLHSCNILIQRTINLLNHLKYALTS